MSQGVRPSIIMGVLAALLFSMIVATSAFIQLPAPGGFYGVRPRQAWPRFGARARPPSPSSSSSDVRMCITGLAAPFAWRKGVRSSRHQAVRQDAALQPPVRASTRRPFSLARAVLLGPFAFEVYNDPQRDQGRWQQWAQDTEVAVLDDAFLCELYRGEVTVKVLSVSEAATQARAGGKVLGHTKHQATESWLPNLLGFAGGSEGAGESVDRWGGAGGGGSHLVTTHLTRAVAALWRAAGDAAKAQSSATNAVLGYTMGEECSGSLPMSLVAAARHAAEGSMTAAAAASYVATPMGAATPREQQAGVSFSACVRRSAPASSLNLTLSLEDDKALLGKAVVDLRSLVGEAGRQVGQSTVVRQEVQLTGGEGGLVVQLELSYTPFAFPAPPERAQPSTLAAAGQGVKQEEQEPWLGAKGCSRDWRKLARVVGEEAVSGKDMRLLAFLENRGTDAQLKVWRDEKRKRLIVAFRGTDPTRLGDLIIDLKLLQVSGEGVTREVQLNVRVYLTCRPCGGMCDLTGALGRKQAGQAAGAGTRGGRGGGGEEAGGGRVDGGPVLVAGVAGQRDGHDAERAGLVAQHGLHVLPRLLQARHHQHHYPRALAGPRRAPQALAGHVGLCLRLGDHGPHLAARRAAAAAAAARLPARASPPPAAVAAQRLQGPGPAAHPPAHRRPLLQHRFLLASGP